MLIDGNPEDNNIGLSMLDSYGIYHYLRWNYFEKNILYNRIGSKLFVRMQRIPYFKISIGKEKEYIEFEIKIDICIMMIVICICIQHRSNCF